jgi:hypothetical protein
MDCRPDFVLISRNGQHNRVSKPLRCHRLRLTWLRLWQIMPRSQWKSV